MFGDDIDAFTSWLNDFLEKNNLKTTSSIEDATNKIVNAVKEKSTTGGIFSSAWSSATTSSQKDADGNALSIFSQASGIANIASSLSSSLGTLLNSVMPIIDAVSSGAWWMEILVQVVAGFVSVMGPMVETVLAPLNNALTLTGEMLAQVFLPIFDSIYPIMQILSDMLMTFVVPAFQLLSPIIELVALVFDALTPVIALVGKAFTIVASPIQYVADLFTWLGKWISYLGQCIGTAVYNITHPFSTKSMP